MAQPELWRRKRLDPDAQTETGLVNLRRRLGMREQALLYLIWLGFAELVVSIWEPRAGMIMHGAILMVLLIHATMYARGLWQKFLIALALAPLIRLLSLTMPLPSFPFVYWYFVVGLPLFIATFLVMRYGRLSATMVGLTTDKLVWQILIGLTGLGFGLLEYLILQPNPLVEELHWRYIWLPALILLIFTGFLEELIFRGVMQYTALRRLGRFGMLYVALVFTVLHIGYRSILDLIFVFVVAIFFAYVVQRTGSILGVTISHGVINIGLFLIFPFLLAKPVEQLPSPQEIMAPRPVLSATAIIIPTRTPTPTFTPSPTSTPVTPTITSTPTASQTAIIPTETPLPTATVCSPQAGWDLYIVREGDSWRNVAQRYGMTAQSLKQANCLDNGTAFYIGQQIFVPYRFTLPTALPTKRSKPKARDNNVVNPSPTPVEVQPTSQPATPTIVLPTNTPVLPTESPLPPSVTPPRPTQVPPSATSDPLPTTTMLPTLTVVPPTQTSSPPTQVPPTSVPPTVTSPAPTQSDPTPTSPTPTQSDPTPTLEIPGT